MNKTKAEMNGAPPTLAVVVPVYNESEVLPAFHKELTAVLGPMDAAYEIIYVDDGSTDGTDRIIESFGADVRGVVLSRNFGHQAALLAGMNAADADYIVMMDGDLQHPPALIPELWKRACAGADVVQTVRSDANTGWFKRISAKAFYRLFNLLTNVKLDFNAADFRLITRRVRDAVVRLNEQDLFLRGIFPWLGFKTEMVTYSPAQRYAGETKYSLRKMISLSMSGITAFSAVPIRISLLLCACSLLVAAGYSSYAVYISAFTDTEVPGWASQLILTSFYFSGVFIVLAVLGDYIGRIHFETKKRPAYVVDRLIGH